MRNVIIVIFGFVSIAWGRAEEVALDHGKAISEQSLAKIRASADSYWLSGSWIRTTTGDVEKERLHFKRKNTILIVELLGGKVVRVGLRKSGDDNLDSMAEEKVTHYFEWKEKNSIAIQLGKDKWLKEDAPKAGPKH